MSDQRPLRVLLVEDDPGDVVLVEEALASASASVVLTIVEDGERALAHLRANGATDGVHRPDLVVLDLNLPKVNGREVLRSMKADDRLSAIPVVVLTTSQADEDILGAYRGHASAYVAKPLDFDEFSRTVKRIQEFYVGTVRLPGR